MPRYARDTHGNVLEICSVERPFSNFDFVEKEFSGLPSLRRIMSQVRLHGSKTMVVEELPDIAEDIAQEDADIARYAGLTGTYAGICDSRVRRVSFFTKKFSTPEEIAGISDDEFLGYAILKEDDVLGLGRSIRVFESVVRPNRHVANYIRGAQNWECAIAGTEFNTTGYLYAQQNNRTNVCAHVACRTAAARFHKDGDMSYREMNQAIKADHVKRKVDNGLSTDQMVTILEAAGARCIVADYTKYNGTPKPPFQKYLYGSIESGYPAIVCFRTRQRYHAIPLFGHTFNEDTWVPNAGISYFRVGENMAYIPSEYWLSTYLSHDDNFGSNFCIPRDFLYTQQRCPNKPKKAQPCDMEAECVAYVIATLPKNVKASPIAAEVAGADFLLNGILTQMPHVAETWGTRLKYFAQRNQLVLRAVLIDGEDYPKHLAKVSDWEGNTFKETQIKYLSPLAKEKKLWMIELSVPELFSANHRKVGEVLIRAEVSEEPARNFKCFVLARLPGCFALYKGGGASKPQYGFISNGVQGHVELWGREQK